MKRLSKDEWTTQANTVHHFKYDYSKVVYCGGGKKVIIGCLTHGFFEQKASLHIYNKRGCPKCTTGVLLTKNEWIIKSRKKHGNFYSYSKVVFLGVKKKVLIGCPIHGDFWQIAEKHFSGGCRVCKRNKPVTIEEFVKRVNKIHQNKYDYSLIKKLNGLVSKVKIICPKHGIFEQDAKNHLAGRGCKYCKAGNSSKKEQLWLDICEVPNDQQHRNVHIKINENRFVVDGIFQDEKIIFEFLGDFWHGHPTKYDPDKINKISKEKFSHLFEKTVNRIRLFRKHGYKVISIWESNFDRRIKANKNAHTPNCGKSNQEK